MAPHPREHRGVVGRQRVGKMGPARRDVAFHVGGTRIPADEVPGEDAGLDRAIAIRRVHERSKARSSPGFKGQDPLANDS